MGKYINQLLLSCTVSQPSQHNAKLDNYLQDNAELGERFKIVKDDYPVVMMFVQKEGQEREEFKFVGEFKNENLKSFIRQNTGIYLPLAGCIEEFDHMADKIVNGGDVAAVLKEAEAELAKFADFNKNKR